MMPNTIINGDALTVLRRIESESVNFIITDPPYGIDYQSNRSQAKTLKIANDKKPFIWWLYDAFRILTDGGGLALFQPMGCPTDFYRRDENSRVCGQVRRRVGSRGAWDGRPEKRIRPAARHVGLCPIR